LPTDVLEATVAADGNLLPDGAFRTTAQPLTLADARLMLEKLLGAKRPLVLTGPLTLTPVGRSHAASLEDRLGIPVIGMESPRGIADPALGAFAEILAAADFVLLLGKKLDFTLKFGRPPAFAAMCRFIHVDPDERGSSAAAVRWARASVCDHRGHVPCNRSIDECGTEPCRRNGGGKRCVRRSLSSVAWDRVTTDGRLHPVQALRPLQTILDRHRAPCW
jgi:acetolactate synthase-1/2/3 large subunit